MYCASFNQDASCLVVGDTDGYRIYSCNPFGRFYVGGSGDIGIAEMLFSTSLVATVGQGDDPAQSPRRLRIVNTKRQITICELTFPTAVLRVLMNRQRLVVVLEYQIYLYDIATMKLLHTIETVQNPAGVAALSTASDSGVLVYPSGPVRHSVASSGPPSQAGELTVVDCATLTPLNVVRAHKTPLANIQLNSDGSLLASASTKGTLIRIFSVPAGTLLYQFRRGSYGTHIYSLAFNLKSSLVAVASATMTVHVYRLSTDNRYSGTASGGADSSEAPADSDSDSAMDAVIETKRKGYAASLRRRMSQAREIFPAAVADMWGPKSRGFASFKIPSPVNTPCTVALAPLSNLVYVASLDGSLYHYTLGDDGECSKVAEYSIKI